MTEGKCTFGSRMPIDIHMLNEIISREVKHFRNYKIYRPNFGSIPVTGKFYAAHDQHKSESKEQEEKVDHYHKNVAQTRAKGPRSKYSAPATENQVYGWYFKPLVPMDRNDRRFYNPKKESSHTKVEIIILMNNPKKRA
ncbi:cilia- and flagella-associated protein 144-like [Amyelois transitella]|uniref:cilia- and flagella-associated protein 144-like n=1 Tax=Amyelois transitella TaxID=680683 RepID=UPI00067BF849|nr:cilia- and flagella-associated protein 144-like [Amyelois transitella]